MTPTVAGGLAGSDCGIMSGTINKPVIVPTILQKDCSTSETIMELVNMPSFP